MIRVTLETELGVESSNGIHENPTRIRRMLRKVAEEREERKEALSDETASDADK
jgi:hypothetical protein